MGKFEDIKAVLDGIQPTLDAIAADEADLVKQIADLKAAGAGSVTDAQLDEILKMATDLKTRLEAIDTSVPAPVTPVP